MITFTTQKTLLVASAFVLAAVAVLIPLDAFAQAIGGANTTINQQANQLSQATTNIPRLIAFGAYIIGAFFAVRALFALKGFIEAPDDTPITKVIGFAATSALLILLPYIIGVMSTTIGKDAVTVKSSAQSFQDQGNLN